MEEEQEGMDVWDHENLLTCYLLSQHLPNTTMIHLSHFSMAREHWEKVSQKYTAKSTYAQNNLKQSFLKMHCTKGGDVWAFLTGLRYKHKELTATSVTITDWDYQCTVLRGIPNDLANFACGLLLAMCIINPLAPVDVDMLINHICEEAEHLKNQHMQSQYRQESQKEKELTNETFTATGPKGG
jgi:hypothetical protein